MNMAGSDSAAQTVEYAVDTHVSSILGNQYGDDSTSSGTYRGNGLFAVEISGEEHSVVAENLGG